MQYHLDTIPVWEALEKRAGGSLKAILAKLTSGRFSGLLTGLAVTGFDFFASLPDNLEKRVESNYSLKAWH